MAALQQRTIKVPENILDWFKSQADADVNTSVNQLIRRALTHYKQTVEEKGSVTIRFDHKDGE